jgi:hypothetical protein
MQGEEGRLAKAGWRTRACHAVVATGGEERAERSRGVDRVWISGFA